MERHQLEHVIRAAADVLGEPEVVVVGSQSALGAFPDGLPKRAVLSMEIDIAAVDDPDGSKADMIAGSLGEMTRFQQMYGYWVDGVHIDLIRLPEGWRDRLVAVCNASTNGATGWCLEPHDLCVAKLLAGRGKDIEYVQAMVNAGRVDPGLLIERARRTDATVDEIERFGQWTAAMRRPGRRTKYRREMLDLRRWVDNARRASTPEATTATVETIDALLHPPMPTTQAVAPTQTHAPPAAPPAQRCGAWMPVANARCVLGAGHSGHHRSH